MSGICNGHTVRESTYPYERIWSTAVRFLRVDSGYTLVEQDKETGYVLFEYQDAGRTLNGALEIYPVTKNGITTVSVGLRIQQMPSYVESLLMDKLVRKLRDEYGTPSRARRTAPQPQQRGAGGRTDAQNSEAENNPTSDAENSDVDDTK